MLRLKLFGTPQLEGPTGVVPQPGPRRLALLASLAAAGPAGLTRDKVVARLWPEADDDRARRNLSQVLYSMKSELGAELVDGTGTLHLDPAQCWSDVGAFDLAVAERRDADAVALYAGPFLDGFHLSDSSEFSAWADGERDRRAASVRSASVRLAESLPASDPVAITAAWARAVALDPLDPRLVLRLVDALAAEGDRTGAVRAADQYAARVRAELDAEPDPGVVKRADALRKAPAAMRDSRDARPASKVEAERADAGPDTPAAETLPGAPAAGRESPAPRRRYFLMGAGALAAVLAILAWTQRAPAALQDGEFVLLAEFNNGTSDSLLTGTVGTAVAAALQQSAHVVPLPRGRLASALRRMERPDTSERLDPELARDVAQREGVRLVLAGDIIESGNEREIISRIIEARTGRILATRRFRVATSDGLLSAIDRLAATMRRDLGEASSTVDAAIPLPYVTTPSLQALHYYAAGLDAARRDNDELASELYLRAVALDSNFASAHAQLGVFASANNDVPLSAYHFGRALAQVDRIPVDEGLRIRISAAFARGDMEQAVSLSRRYLALRPRDAGAWARVGFYLYTSGQTSAARAAYATADSLSPLSAASVMNIGNAWFADARREGDRARFDSARVYYERAIGMQPSLEFSTFYNHQYGTILLGAGLADSARATFGRMMQREPLDRARGLRSSAFLEAMQGRWRTAADQFGQAAEISIASRQWTSAMRNDALRADLLLTVGDRAGADAALRRATAIALREPLETRAVAFIALAQVKAGDAAAAGRLLDRMRSAARPEHGGEQAAILTVEGARHLAAGRANEALTALRSAFVRDSTSTQSRTLLARALSATGDDAGAAASWNRLAMQYDFGVEGQFDWQFAKYEEARALERLGRLEQAIEAYRSLVAAYPVGASEFEAPTLRDARARLRKLETGGR